MLAMKTRFTVVALVILVAGPAAAEEPKSPVPDETRLSIPSEPTKCFRLVGTFDKEMPIGLATV